jgi:hypothetical protein
VLMEPLNIQPSQTLEKQAISTSGGVWAEIRGNMRHLLFECADCGIYDECTLGPHRWELLVKHPLRFTCGRMAIAEGMHFVFDRISKMCYWAIGRNRV